jgi:hypothetical protein
MENFDMLQISLVFFLLPSTNIIKIYNQIEKFNIIIFVVIMFNLPKSVAVNKADVRGNLDQVKFEQLGEAIAALGTSLGQSLGLYICLSC